MNEIKNISNDTLLIELQERLNKGEIKIRGNELMGKLEKDKNTYYTVRLDLNVGKLVNEVIEELKEERDLMRKEKEWQEKQYEKKLETLKTGNQSP